MLGDGDEISGRHAGYSCWWHRPCLSASRERDRTIGGDQRQAVRAVLDSLRALERRIAEDVEIGGEFLYASGVAGDGVCAGDGALPAAFGALSAETELHVRRVEGRGFGDRTLAESGGEIARGETRARPRRSDGGTHPGGAARIRRSAG